MKIGIDGRASRWYRGTGIGTYTYQLVSSLNHTDKDNSFILFMPDDTICSMNLNDNFHAKYINQNIKNNFWDEVNIPNILKGEDIELYHVPQNGIGLPSHKECRFVITLHDVIPYKMPHTVGEQYLKIFNEEIPHIIPLCDGIITVSEFSKQDIIKTFNYPSQKIFVTYLAAEDIYKPMNKQKAKSIVKKYYSIDEDYILYVGGFSPRKNITGLIEAFSKFKQIYKKNIKLVIAGKQGKSYDDYKKRARELNIESSILFPGFISIEHMPSLYCASELFVYPSFYEGFGLPPVEAMSCAVPVIASSVTSIPEVLKDSAMLINPDDIDGLCSSMHLMLSDDNLKQKFILKGLVRSSELSWKETAHKTIIAYSKIVNNID